MKKVLQTIVVNQHLADSFFWELFFTFPVKPVGNSRQTKLEEINGSYKPPSSSKEQREVHQVYCVINFKKASFTPELIRLLSVCSVFNLPQ